MKFSLVAALVVVLAVAHGTEAGSLVKRDTGANFDQLTKILSDMSAKINSASQDMAEKMKAVEVTNIDQEQIKHLVDKAQAEATNLQEQVKPAIATIMENFQTEVKSLSDMLDKLFKQVIVQTKALSTAN